MKIGVNSLFIMKFEFDEALRLIQDLGAEAIEVAIMGEETRKFCDIDRLLANKDELKRWLDLLKLHGLQISALCAHGEPLVTQQGGGPCILPTVSTGVPVWGSR